MVVSRRLRTGCLTLLAVLVAASSPLAEEAAAQNRPLRVVFGAAPVWVTAFGGDAWEGMAGGPGVSALAGVRSGPWRAAIVGLASGHDRDAGLSRNLDLLAISAEMRRDFLIGELGARAYVGGRLGVVHQEFDESSLAVLEIDLIPGTEVTAEDTGVLFGPVAGAVIPLAGPLEVDVSGSLQWADVTPFILGPDAPEPGLSRLLALSAALTVGL